MTLLQILLHGSLRCYDVLRKQSGGTNTLSKKTNISQSPTFATYFKARWSLAMTLEVMMELDVFGSFAKKGRWCTIQPLLRRE